MALPIRKDPWNRGKLVDQTLPLKLEQRWAIRIWLEIAKNIRELAVFKRAIDCKLRSCDRVKLLVRDTSRNGDVDSTLDCLTHPASESINRSFPDAEMRLPTGPRPRRSQTRRFYRTMNPQASR